MNQCPFLAFLRSGFGRSCDLPVGHVIVRPEGCSRVQAKGGLGYRLFKCRHPLGKPRKWNPSQRVSTCSRCRRYRLVRVAGRQFVSGAEELPFSLLFEQGWFVVVVKGRLVLRACWCALVLVSVCFCGCLCEAFAWMCI